MLACADTQIVDCGDGVRLLGHYSSQSAAGARRRVTSRSCCTAGKAARTRSTCCRSAAHLFSLGCDVFRLNFRDHGPSHHLNEDIFHSCRLDEVVGAVRRIQQTLPEPTPHARGLLARRQFRVARRGAGASSGNSRWSGGRGLSGAASAQHDGRARERLVHLSPVLHRQVEALVAPQAGAVPAALRLRRDPRAAQHQGDDRDPGRALQRVRGSRRVPQWLRDRRRCARAARGARVTSCSRSTIRSFRRAICRSRAQRRSCRSRRIPHGGHCGFMDRLNRESWADRQIARFMGFGRRTARGLRRAACGSRNSRSIWRIDGRGDQTRAARGEFSASLRELTS